MTKLSYQPLLKPNIRFHQSLTDAAPQFLFKLIPLSMVYRDALLAVAAYAPHSVAKTFRLARGQYRQLRRKAKYGKSRIIILTKSGKKSIQNCIQAR